MQKFATHMHIIKKGDQNYIECLDAGGDVLVNYRLIEQQSIKRRCDKNWYGAIAVL